MSEAVRSSLDLGKNDSTSPDDGDSGRYDCRTVYSNFGYYRDEPDAEKMAPFRCGSWECYCCGYRMRQNLVEEIERVCRDRPDMSRLLTLTLDPSKVPDGAEDHKYLTERWNALRTRLKREVGDFSYIWVREEQENGNPHLHAIVSRYLPQEVVSRSWSDLGGGEIVDIRKIERVEKAAHYVGKYLTKDALSGLPSGIQRYNSSADIHLEVRGGDSTDGESEMVLKKEVVQTPDEDLVLPVIPADFPVQRDWGGPVPPPPDGR